ncbi:hypothetical protein ACVIIW_005288 [Bradyrhizobium sp. USDA 4449]
MDDVAVQWCKCPKTGFFKPVLLECNYWFPLQWGATSARQRAIALATIEIIDALGTKLVAKLQSLASALDYTPPVSRIDARDENGQQENPRSRATCYRRSQRV